MNYFKDNYRVLEEKIYIGDIACLRLLPEDERAIYPSIIFYHGLGSNKERQRIRAYILASLGYQVFLPDSIHHGERGAKYTEDPTLLIGYFWQSILTSLEEFPLLREKIIQNYRGDKENIFVSGHSMGGFISAGIITHNSAIRAAIPINASFNWEASMDYFLRVESIDGEIDHKERNLVKKYNPANNIEKLKGKNILILHGREDKVVNINPQRDFYNGLKDKAEYKKISMIEYEDLGHFITTATMEDLIEYIKSRELYE